jgi:putative hydrolase of the HAD superfamily
MSITTVVFDFGNVLGFFSHRRAAEQLAAYSSLAAEAILAQLLDSRLEDDYDSGRLSTSAVMGLAREMCRLSCTDEQFATAFGDMFTPNIAVCTLVPLLKPRYNLVLLSNTNDLHARQFLAQFRATLSHFDHLVLSHELGVRKPDPRAYAHCQHLVGQPAAQCLFIDDLPSNVAAARACGWQGIVYEPGLDLHRALAGCGIFVREPRPS